MKIFRNIKSFQKFRADLKSKATVGLIPTMGALHEGHLSLVRESMKKCDLTVVSIFVNPTQFSPVEDLTKYPRTEKEDLKRLSQAKVDAVFIPSVPDELYPHGIGKDLFRIL